LSKTSTRWTAGVVLHEMSLDFLSFTRAKGAHLKIAIIDRDSGSRDLLAD
jgi:hypothetical protein